MHTRPLKVAFLNRAAVILFGLILYAQPFVVEAADPPPPEGFVTQLIAGINARDLAKIKPLIHPQSLGCITQDNEDYYAWVLWQDGSEPYQVPAAYQARLDTSEQAKKLHELLKSGLHWPVKPDANLDLSYEWAPNAEIERVFQVTLQNSKMLLVLDCPDVATLVQFRVLKDATLARAAKTEKLLKSISPKDKKTYAAMIARGKKIDAMQAAEKQYHLDPGDSLALIDRMQYEHTP